MKSKASDGFTLVEVCLAISVMAMGLLALCGLYGLGFRESLQSEEDVVSVGLADAYLAPLVQGLSDRNLTWSQWQQIGETPSELGENVAGIDGILPKKDNGIGWGAYVRRDTSANDDFAYRVIGNPSGLASEVFEKLPHKGSAPSLGEYHCGLVATRHGGVVQLAFRASRRSQTLMTQPVYVVEVRFQGTIGGAQNEEGK